MGESNEVQAKSDAPAVTKEHVKWAEKVTGEKVGSIKTDIEGAVLSTQFREWCADEGTQRCCFTLHTLLTNRH